MIKVVNKNVSLVSLIQNDANGQVLKSWLVVFTVWSRENIQHLEVQEVSFWNAWSERKTSKTYTQAGEEEVLQLSPSTGGESCVSWDSHQ